MVKIQLKNNKLMLFGVPTLLFLSLIFLTKSTPLIGNEVLNFGITIDFLVTVPLIYYLLLRKTKIPKTTVVPVMMIGILIGLNVVPETNRAYFNLFRSWILPLLELSILIFVVLRVNHALKKLKSKDTDFFTGLKNTCKESFPRMISILLIAEISVLYYGFFYWKKRKFDINEFSYYKKSGTLSLLFAILLIVAVETVVAHILLSKWSHTAAWIFTFLSIYSAIQIFGFLKSMIKRPYMVKGNRLFLTYGIMNETIIALEEVEDIELSSKLLDSEDEVARLSFFGTLESHNVVIRLKNENVLEGLYGRKKSYKTLLLHVDEKKEFISRLNVKDSSICR